MPKPQLDRSLPVSVWNALPHRRESPEGRRSSLTPETLPGLQALSATDSIMFRGKMTPPHLHPDAEELLYVLEGEIAFSAHDPVSGNYGTKVLSPGSAVHIPAMRWHWYTGLDEQSRLLSMYSAVCPHILEAGDVWGFQEENSQPPASLQEQAHPLHDSSKPAYQSGFASGNSAPSRSGRLPAPPWLKRN